MTDINELEGLSETERAALEEDFEGATIDDLNELLNEDDDEGGDGEAEAGETDESGEDNGDGLDPTEAEVSGPVLVQHADVAEIGNNLEAVKAEIRDLKTKWRNMELDIDEDAFEAKLEELQDKRDSLVEMRAEARSKQALNEQLVRQAYLNKAELFMQAVKLNEGIDLKSTPDLYQSFDTALKFLGNDPRNADWTAEKFFEEAKEMVKARHRLGQSSANESNKPGLQDELARRRKGVAEASKVPSLSKLPQAGIENEGENEFSHLDRLSGADLEKALAKLTEDQIERYFRAA